MEWGQPGWNTELLRNLKKRFVQIQRYTWVNQFSEGKIFQFLSFSYSYGEVIGQIIAFHPTPPLLGVGDPLDWDILDPILAFIRIFSHLQLLIGESPSNPRMSVLDLEGFGKLGQEKGITTMVDSTFAPPSIQEPIKYGIDIVAHSAYVTILLFRKFKSVIMFPDFPDDIANSVV